MTDLRLRIVFDTAMLGPGKAELLDHIRDTGSISAAGRRMGMSYKRAWSLVETMNAAFNQPLVASSRGGQGGGGAQLTPTGLEVLSRYHLALDSARNASAEHVAALEALLRPAPDMSEGK